MLGVRRTDANGADQLGGLAGEAAGRARHERLLLLLPEEGNDPIAVDDRGHRVGKPLGDLLAGARDRNRARELEQRARLLVAPACLVVGRGGVEHRRRKARVHVEELALVGEEGARWRRRHEAAVIARRRGDVGDEPAAA